MLKQAGPRGKANAVRNAKLQRRNMSPPEIALWQVLRQRPGGLKFRRQHPLGDELALDFYCNDARLAIEVDGQAHGCGDRPWRDARRDAALKGWGISTLRLPATAVLKDLDAVVTYVLDQARIRLPLHHRPKEAGGPSPRDELGED